MIPVKAATRGETCGQSPMRQMAMLFQPFWYECAADPIEAPS